MRRSLNNNAKYTPFQSKNQTNEGFFPFSFLLLRDLWLMHSAAVIILSILFILSKNFRPNLRHKEMFSSAKTKHYHHSGSRWSSGKGGKMYSAPLKVFAKLFSKSEILLP